MDIIYLIVIIIVNLETLNDQLSKGSWQSIYGYSTHLSNIVTIQVRVTPCIGRSSILKRCCFRICFNIDIPTFDAIECGHTVYVLLLHSKDNFIFVGSSRLVGTYLSNQLI